MSEAMPAGWAIETLIATTALMALVLILRGPIQRVFGARVAYALWALPALRMVLPRIPGWSIDPFGALARTETAPLSLPAGAAIARDAVPAASLAPSFDWAPLLLAVWLGGAALYLAWQLGAHRRFMRRALISAQVRRRDFGVAILSGPEIPGPLATGLLRPAILLPDEFTARYAPRERRLVLAHEMAHHARGDLWANLVGLMLLSLHWFNPVAHVAWRAFRNDQEMACDETVLSTAAADAAGWYGRAVVKSAAPRFPAAACAMHGMGLVKRRLRLMARPPGGTLRTLAGAAVGTALTLGGLAGTASGGALPAPLSATPAGANAAHPKVTAPRVPVMTAQRDQTAVRAAPARVAPSGSVSTARAASDAPAMASAAHDYPAPLPPSPPAVVPGSPPPAPVAPAWPIDGAALEREIAASFDRTAVERQVERAFDTRQRAELERAALAHRASIRAEGAARHARAAAMSGLRSARAAIAASAMPDHDRAEALVAIDGELARFDAGG